MTRRGALAVSFALPLLVGGALLGVLLGGGNEDAEGWWRAASFTVLPAAAANALGAWIVALRPGASRPANGAGVFLRAFSTFALAVPLAWPLSSLAIAASGEAADSAFASGLAVALFAALTGVFPMTLLQWLTYHFTLERRTP